MWDITETMKQIAFGCTLFKGGVWLSLSTQREFPVCTKEGNKTVFIEHSYIDFPFYFSYFNEDSWTRAHESKPTIQASSTVNPIKRIKYWLWSFIKKKKKLRLGINIIHYVKRNWQESQSGWDCGERFFATPWQLYGRLIFVQNLLLSHFPPLKAIGNCSLVIWRWRCPAPDHEFSDTLYVAQV